MGHRRLPRRRSTPKSTTSVLYRATPTVAAPIAPVVSPNEGTGMHALERKAPWLPRAPIKVECREFAYSRDSTCAGLLSRNRCDRTDRCPSLCGPIRTADFLTHGAVVASARCCWFASWQPSPSRRWAWGKRVARHSSAPPVAARDFEPPHSLAGVRRQPEAYVLDGPERNLVENSDAEAAQACLSHLHR
jgi:hypothetical protein